MMRETNTIKRAPGRAVKATAKLGAAGATIFAIGWFFLTMSPAGEVQESQADIVDLELLAPETNTQKFVSALDDLGHEQPRIYDYNGADIYFSTRATSTPPRELIEEYQRAFVNRGVNSKVWDSRTDYLQHARDNTLPRAAGERVAAMLSGELQVVFHDENRVIMTAALLDAERAEQHAKKSPDGVAHFDQFFQSHRHIDATWDPVHQRTLVTATWSDEDFDIRKTMPTALQPTGMTTSSDRDVPTCIGCERLTRFAATANDAPYVKQVFETSRGPQEIKAFYERAMSSRGWRSMPTSQISARVRHQLPEKFGDQIGLQFSRGTTFVTITIQIDEETNKTVISTMMTD